MIGFKFSLVVLLVVVLVAGRVMTASAQADHSTPIGPQPLLPCTQLADAGEPQAAESPLAALESFLARFHENPFEAHVEQMERCYPLYIEPEAWPSWA